MNTHPVLKQWPNHILFRLLHYALIALQLRDELGRDAVAIRTRYTRECQPFALWLLNMVLAYAGDILSHLLLGSLPLEPLCCGQDVLFCTLAWYAIFYCPFDLFYAVARTSAFRTLATTMAAISQLLQIGKGVDMAGQVYDKAFVPMLIIGTVMGSGAELLKPVASLLINKCQRNNAAYIKLSTNSKLALVISWLYALETHKRLLFGITRSQLKLYVLIALITFKYMSLTYRTEHMIWLLESKLCYALFGDFFADLVKYLERQPGRRHKYRSKFD